MPRKVESVGSAIQRLRKERGVSLNKLARDADTAPINVSRIEEGGRGLTVDMLLRIARALGVHLAEFNHCESLPRGKRANGKRANGKRANGKRANGQPANGQPA